MVGDDHAMVAQTTVELHCQYLDRAAAVVKHLLADVLKDVAKVQQNYGFTDRLKGPQKILLKVQRKREEGRERLRSEGPTAEVQKLLSYEPRHLTDAWGCRFITLFQSEIPATIRAILMALSDYNRKHFALPIILKEFVIYTNRPLGDPLSIADETKDIVSNSVFAGQILNGDTIIRPPENRKSAYSSVHFVFSKAVKDDSCPTISSLAFELQVRDIFEEGWGQIQHHLLYSEKDNLATPLLEQNKTEQWRPHLNALKIFVDGCSQHASLIKQSYDLTRKLPLVSQDTLSVSSREKDREAVMDLLHAKKAPPAALAAVTEAYKYLQLAGDLE